MARKEHYELNKQIAHWQQKREQLAEWVQTHHIGHPEFEAKFRELNNVTHKINQLKARKKPVKFAGTGTVSLPAHLIINLETF